MILTGKIFLALVLAVISFLSPRFADENSEEKPEEKPEEKKEPEKDKSPEEDEPEEADLSSFGIEDESDEKDDSEKPEDKKLEKDKPEEEKKEKPIEDEKPQDKKPEEKKPAEEPKKGTVKDYFKAVSKMAKEEVAKEFGEEFDEFNPDHQAAFSVISRDIVDQDRETQNRVALEKKAQEKASAILSTKELKAFTKEKFESLSYREAKKIELANESGDYEAVLKFYEKCKKEFEDSADARKKAGEKIRTLKPKAGNPPVVEGSGSGDSGHEIETAGLEDFGLSGRT